MASLKAHSKLGVLGAVLLCWAGFANADEVSVSNAAQLQSAVAAANSAGGNRTILLANGTYRLTDTLWIKSPGITIAGQSATRQNVIIEGDAMSSSAQVGSLIWVGASNFQVRDVTLQKSRNHLIQVAGETNADSPTIKNCILRDAYEQMIKVSFDSGTPSVHADNGLVENCLFEYTAGRGPQYYIGGIDAHAAKNWTVRNNTFRNIASPNTSFAEFAVHFWNGSADNIVERNVIVDCDRGIGFGMEDRPPNVGGVIRNNMIFHANNGAQFADVGIALLQSQNTKVYNNSIYFENNFPWAIEYRFGSTTGALIVNNLANRAVQLRDGASGTVGNNVTNATASWLKNRTAGDLHLTSAVSGVIDAGRSVDGLTNDIDDQKRPQGSGIDIGADEFAAGPVPMPPTGLTVN